MPLLPFLITKLGRDSFQLFVGVFDTCQVWYLLVLPSHIHADDNMTSLREIDGDTSYHSHKSFSFGRLESFDRKALNGDDRCCKNNDHSFSFPNPETKICARESSAPDHDRDRVRNDDK